MASLKNLPLSLLCRGRTPMRVATVRPSLARRPYAPSAPPALSARRHMASAAASDPRLSLMDASCLSETQRQVRDSVFRVCADFPDVRYVATGMVNPTAADSY